MKDLSVHAPASESIYDEDFFAWTQRVSEQLLQGVVSDTDLAYIAEEIADMGKRDLRELRSRMTVLVMHLMKWAAQPERRDGSTWKGTISAQRLEIEDLLDQSPSLRARLIGEFPTVYRRAAKLASDETGLPISHFRRPNVPDNEKQLKKLLSPLFLPEKIQSVYL